MKSPEKPGRFTLHRCVLWDNAGGDFESGTVVVDASFSLTEGSFPGPGNLSGLDPMLVLGPSGAPALSQVTAGDGVDSVALDAGDVAADELAVGYRSTRTDGVRDEGVVDLGFHAEASSYSLLRGTRPESLSTVVTDVVLPVRDPDPVGGLLFYAVDADRAILLAWQPPDVVVLFEHHRFDAP